jgi:hypothetical protein
MMAPRPETVHAALIIVTASGQYGISLGEFASQWRGQLRKNQVRKSLAGVGKFLGRLMTDGLLDRSAPAPHGRFTLTRAGEKFVVEVADEYGLRPW